MTRARARALETEVTSLLSQVHFDAHKAWLLPQTETLCILRCQGVSHEEAKEQGESEGEDGREEEEMRKKLQAPIDRPGPDVRRSPGSGRLTQPGRPTHPHPSQNYEFPKPPGRPTPTERPTEDHPSRIYGRPTGTGRSDPREPPDDR